MADERGGRVARVTRRDFLIAAGAGALAGGAGLVLGVWYGQRRERWAKRVPPRAEPFAPNVYLAIDTEGTTSIWLTRSEMGQGVSTALPMMLAEELDADWERVRVVRALANQNYGGQLTGSSASVRGLWDTLREAGASAREMLIAAAAAQWGVSASDCRAERGSVVHAPSGRRLGYGALAEAAAALPVPASPRLKPPAERVLMGRPLPRLDVPDKTAGRARYGLDVRLPGMRFATVVRCPVFGGKLESFDEASVRGEHGVTEAFAIESGIAIVADTTWAALSAAKKLQVKWQLPPGPAFDDREHARALDAALEQPGQAAHEHGDAARFEGAGKRVEARYRAPYLAHATMEPINATAWMRGERLEIWAPTQAPQGAQAIGAELTGKPLADVVVHITELGGGFGRRAANLEVRDAVQVAQRVKVPVQVVWSREEDVQQDVYRTVSHHRLEAALDAEGVPVAWRHRIASPSLLGKDSTRGEVDPTMLDGATDFPYAIDRVEVRWASVPSPVPLGFWRSVAHSFNAFAVECFVDEVARAGGHDPVELRRRLLRDRPRHLGVLERVAELARWNAPAVPGVGRGVAVHESFGSFVAMVAEVAFDETAIRVPRVWAAVDCGQTVNPQIIEAQIEGGIAFGLTAALHGRIDVREGRVVQSNFHDYPLLRFPEMPEVQVAILDSDHDPGGVGEIAVPPIAPAVANALYALTGEPARELPLGTS